MITKSDSVKRAQRRKKELAVQRMGGKCQICGYDKCINALEFHHIDPSTKAESPSYIVMRRSWEKVQEELSKCIMLCANCHREMHYKELDIDLQSVIGEWINVSCKTCNTTFKTQEKNQLYCSNICRGVASRKVTRPTKDELEMLIQTTSWTKIGKMFGVSDNAVRKWAKSYKLI